MLELGLAVDVYLGLSLDVDVSSRIENSRCTAAVAARMALNAAWLAAAVAANNNSVLSAQRLMSALR